MSHDDVQYLTAFADDLTMSRLKLKERIPKGIAASGKAGHSKNIRGFFTGPGYYFYSLGMDKTLRMWETDRNVSKSLHLPATSVCTVCIPFKDLKGEWSFANLLASGHDHHTGARRMDSVEVSFRRIDLDDMSATGSVTEQVERQLTGVWQYAKQEMEGSQNVRLC